MSTTMAPPVGDGAATAIIPTQNDVLFGRGPLTNKHPGNQLYRSLIDAQKPTFLAETIRKVKRSIAINIKQQIQNLHPPGRFLVEDRNRREDEEILEVQRDSEVHPLVYEKVWVEVSDDKTMVKIMHRLRDKEKDPTKRRSSNKKAQAAISNSSLVGDEDDELDLQEDIGGQFDDIFDDTGISNGLQLDDVFNEDANKDAEQFDDIFDDTEISNGQYDGVFDDTREDSGQFDDVFDDTLETSVSILGEKCDSLGLDNELGEPGKEQQQPHELTLKQWRSKMLNCEKAQSSDQVSSGFMKSAISIAVNLADFLIEEKEDQDGSQGNPVPLESILAENVLIQVNEPNLMRGGEIEHAWILSLSMEANPRAGTVMARLFAMGKILFELLSGDEFTSSMLGDGMPSHDGTANHDEALNGEENGIRPTKRSSQSQSTYSEDISSNCIARLEAKGYPSSVRALVRNLLDCGKSDHCGGDAYSSFLDLKEDLSLMLADPLRFLDDIQVNNGLPTLEICDKLYGREKEEEKLDQLYQRHIDAKEFKGVIISGGAGVGKSHLAMHIQKLTSKASGYFCTTKFQQNNMHVKPLSTIGALFDSLCDRYAEDASPLQSSSVSDDLANALGNQAGLLAGVVPSLLKLMPHRISLEETSNACVDAPSSMRYLFGELLRVISSRSSRPISLLIDDIQFADSSSLLLISDLLFSAARSDLSVFFAFCHRDNDPDLDSGTFDIWLSSISMYMLEELKLDNMNVEGVNSLISDSLHLSPRITRPLSAVLQHKTMGNPLFVRRLLVSLTGQGYIFVDLSQPRWAWDLKKIADQEISESVLGLLMKEMERLPSDHQLGLKVASCLGSCVQKNVLEILSREIDMDLIDILRQVSEKGFMNNSNGMMMFSFAHDKIQQAAYELMSDQQRRENHMQYGMAICLYTLDNCPDNNDLFFIAITQINHGGPNLVSDPSKRRVIALLNLKAGNLSIIFSDYTTALSLFKHGISYLGDDKWSSNYELSLNLFDAAAEAAGVLNKNEAVTSYTKELVTHAKCYDDSLNCLTVAAKSLYQAGLVKESMSSSFDILSKLGEKPLRDISDPTLHTDMQTMNEILRNTSDESILNMQNNHTKKTISMMKLIANLGHVFHSVKPSLLGAVSLRMVELSMKDGLVSSSPLAFGCYGEVLVVTGSVKEGCRFGRLALKLVENTGLSVDKSALIALVYTTILWAVEPLQSCAEAYKIGIKVGQQSGDVLHKLVNWQMSIMTSYLAGDNLDKVQANNEDFILTMQSQNGHLLGGSILLYHQACALKEGLIALDIEPPNNIPTEKEAVEQFRSPLFLSNYKIHQLVRAYLLHRLDDLQSLDMVNISDDIAQNKHPLRPFFLFGIFYEGLASFLLARLATRDSERSRWIEKGENVLTKIRFWNEHSSWNWESKKVLLEAERMHTLVGSSDQASLLYEKAIRSAREHKFINDEAIASELAGMYFHQQGLHVECLGLLLHSIQSYKTWGATAVAKRVETFISIKYGSFCLQQIPNSVMLERIMSLSIRDSSKKRDIHNSDM